MTVSRSIHVVANGILSFLWLSNIPSCMLVFAPSLSRVQLFAAPWTAARQASLSFTISQSLLKLMSIESVMPSNHLILCRRLLLLPPILPSIRVFSSESALSIRWPKYWSSSSSFGPSSLYCAHVPHLFYPFLC